MTCGVFGCLSDDVRRRGKGEKAGAGEERKEEYINKQANFRLLCQESSNLRLHIYNKLLFHAWQLA